MAKKKISAVLFWLVIFSGFNGLALHPPEDLNPEFQKQMADFAQHVQWLESRICQVKLEGKTYFLVQSYENLNDRCWIYDQALAVMVFVALGEIDLCRKILDTLGYLQNPDGSFYFSYKISTLESTSDRKYTGAIAWVAMAINFYHTFTQDPLYNALSWKTLNWLCLQQVMDGNNPASGGISLGARDDAFSLEHNLDTYSAFQYYHNRYFWQRARKIKAFILKNLFQDTDNPHFITGYNDFSLYLDCQSWSVLTLGERFCPVLPFAENQFQVKNGILNGQSDIQGFFERQVENAPVWSEGTEGMALAYFFCNQPDKAEYYHQQVKRMTGSQGGIAYATENQYDFSTSPSVAGTAWHLFYEMKLNPFRPYPKTKKAVIQFLKKYEKFIHE